MFRIFPFFFLFNYEVTKIICPLGVKPIDIGVTPVTLLYGNRESQVTPGLANGIRTGCGIWAYGVDVFAQPTPDWTLVGAIKGLRFFE